MDAQMQIAADYSTLVKISYTFLLIFIPNCVISQSSKDQEKYTANKNPEDTIFFDVLTDFERSLSKAVQFIQSGSVIAIPTDTIYGLAADAENIEAIRKLYEIKGRNSTKPVSICVHDINSINHWGYAKHLPEEMLYELLPGPVTILLNRTANLNSLLNPTDEKIGIRIPECDFVQKLTAALKKPIALTSANKSGGLSSVTVEEFSHLWPALPAVFNRSMIGVARSGSTIVNLSIGGEFKIVRTGGYINSTLAVLKKYGFQQTSDLD